MIHYYDLDGDEIEVTDIDNALRQVQILCELEKRINDISNKRKLHWLHTHMELLKIKYPQCRIYLFQFRAVRDKREWEKITPIPKVFPYRDNAVELARRTIKNVKGEIRITIDSINTSASYFNHYNQ